MLNALSSQAVFLDDDELHEFVSALSDELRRDPIVRPLLDKVVGNHWAACEAGVIEMIFSQLAMASPPTVSPDRLNRLANLINPEQFDRIRAIFMDVCFANLPLDESGQLVEICDALAQMIRPLIGQTDERCRQRLLLDLMTKLRTGCLKPSS